MNSSLAHNSGKNSLKPVMLAIAISTFAPINCHASENNFALELSTGGAHTLGAAQEAVLHRFFGNTSTQFRLESTSQSSDVGWPGNNWEIGLLWARDISSRWKMTTRLSLAEGQYKAPDGIDIFTDPAQFRLHRISLGTFISHQIGTIGPVEFSAQAGLIATRSHAKLSSALLDIRATVETVDGMVGAKTAWPILGQTKKEKAPKLVAELNRWNNGYTDMRLSLQIGF
ncbi:MAG: hypothetical protein N4A53_16040 [Pelagimonas sp.]|jgi:hypothetical protein|nr:hypothetical protein [Pelagimonas sp.]